MSNQEKLIKKIDKIDVLVGQLYEEKNIRRTGTLYLQVRLKLDELRKMVEGPTVTKRELEILRFTLGLDKGDSITRNRFHAWPWHPDWEHLESLVLKGLMTKRRDAIGKSNAFSFRPERAGRDIALRKKEDEE